MKTLKQLSFGFAVPLLLGATLATAWAQSPLGNAISLNGASQYVSIPNFGAIIPTNEITVEFWANASVFGTQSGFMLNPDQNNNRLNCHLNYGGSYANALTYWDFGNISGAGRVDAASPPNSTNNWVHYALVASQSGNFMRIYTNGVLQISQTGMTPFVRGSYELRIGGNTGFFFTGQMDEFRVWNIARSQGQIMTNLASPLVGNETNLVVYYRLDTTSGAVATNSATATGATYNGTLVNGPVWVSSSAATVAVTTNSDSGPGSLRQAILNALPGFTITFATNLSGQTILLTNGQIVLSQSLVIDGSALTNGIQLNGNTNSRIFSVSSGATVTLKSLNLTNGYAGGSPYPIGSGGAVYNSGVLTLNNCALSGNAAAGFGGALENDGLMTLNQCTLAANSCLQSGGGAIDDNASSGGLLTLNQCTLSANSGYAGGLDAFGPVSLFNSIVAGNTSSGGSDFIYGAITITLSGGNLNGGTPLLAPLGKYGGPTQTMPPLPGSPAIDAGSDTATASFTTDQRGLPRLALLHVDIGAAELQSASAPVVVTQPATGLTSSGASVNASVTPDGAVSTYYFHYGLSPSYGASSLTNSLNAGSTNVTANLAGLQAGTVYHFTIIAANSVGTSTGADLTFTTLPVAPNVTNLAATSVLAATATLNGTVNPNGAGTSYYFQYGLTTGYGLSTIPNVLTGTNFNFAVTGLLGSLSPDTLYHYTLIASNSAGVSAGTDLTFTTAQAAPGVANLAATAVTSTTATLNGTVNPNGPAASYYFKYGPTTAYGSFTATNQLAGTNQGLPVSANLTNLSPGSFYHYSLVATNSIGAVSSPDLSFHTGGYTNLVTNTNDDGSPGSLRAVVAGDAAGDFIAFAPNLSGQTILLTNGQINLVRNVTIDASSLTNGITLSGNNVSRIFQVTPGVTNTLTRLTITAGLATNGLGLLPNYGGGIFNQGIISLNRCLLFSNNAYAGGGIYNQGGGLLTLNACTVGMNSASYGGAVQNEGALSAYNSTFGANASSTQGGAISAPFGAPVSLTHCTVTANTSADSGGILGTHAALTNCVVAGNTAATNTDFSGSFTLGGNNLTNGNPFLAALGNYGGPTPTMPPLLGSPVIDAGADFTTNMFATDQRGYPRLSGSHVDLGSVEFQTGLIVTNNSDSGENSLRAAVAFAPTGSTITFAPNLSGQTILLTSGQITLTNDITIDGSALASQILINGSRNSRLFTVINSATVSLKALVFTNGYATSAVGPEGGALYNSGNLTLNNSTLTGNAADGDGGAIYNSGSLTINQSALSRNAANFTGGVYYGGGGIFNDVGGTMTVNACTVAGNSANYGAGIYNYTLNCTLTVNQSTFATNVAADVGGGIFSGGGASLTANDSTFFGNTASFAGGIYTAGAAAANNDTVTGNAATFGGGILNEGGMLNLTNCIVAGNTGASNTNIDGAYSGASNLVDINALLSPLGNYGGPTQTMPPQTNSPAIDAGNDSVASFLATDQRGLPRRSGAHVDIGAVEYQVSVTVAGTPPVLKSLVRLGTGAWQFSFTNTTGVSFTVFTTTNLALPFSTWANLGPAVESPAGSGHFQFTDPLATNSPQRYYLVHSP